VFETLRNSLFLYNGVTSDRHAILANKSDMEPLAIDCIVAKDQIRALIRGSDSRNEVEHLGMRNLYVPRSALPAPEDGEYYHFDLHGLTVVLERDGTKVGVVQAVQDFGAGAFLDVRLDSGGRTATIPFNKDSILNVDLDAGTIDVDERFLL
jgi:16S rRNA processing protein RimM